MKHVDNATALNVSQTIVKRLLKKHRQNGSAKESKQSTLILECQELSLKRYGMWCIFLRPHAAVKGSKRDTNEKFRSFKSKENIHKEEVGPYCGFGY